MALTHMNRPAQESDELLALESRLQAQTESKANKTQEAWITPTLLNGWVNYDVATYPLGYRKNQFGGVEIKGRVMGGTIGQAMFILPVGYRSTQTIAFPVDNNDVYGRVLIYSSGAVSLSTGTNTSVFLSNVAFPTT